MMVMKMMAGTMLRGHRDHSMQAAAGCGCVFLQHMPMMRFSKSPQSTPAPPQLLALHPLLAAYVSTSSTSTICGFTVMAGGVSTLKPVEPADSPPGYYNPSQQSHITHSTRTQGVDQPLLVAGVKVTGPQQAVHHPTRRTRG